MMGFCRRLPTGGSQVCRMLMISGLIAITAVTAAADGEVEDGFVSLFNGSDLSEWTVPEGDNGHWKVVDGVIDYDAQSEASGDRNLWTKREYGDFILKIDWRLKRTSGLYNIPIVLQDGSYLTDATGKKITISTPNADSGVLCADQVVRN